MCGRAVRRGPSLDAPVGDEFLVAPAHEEDVGLDVVTLAEDHVEGADEDLAQIVTLHEIVQRDHEALDEPLMPEPGRRRHVELVVDDLVASACRLGEARELRVRPPLARPVRFHGIPLLPPNVGVCLSGDQW